MTGSAQPVRIHEVFPYLRTRDGAAAIEFYKRAFGAEEQFRLTEPGGRIGHAELKFGAATVMVSGEYPEFGIHAPSESVPTGSAVHLHVDDVDSLVKRAAAAGATVVMEPRDQFYGERTARLRDPFGHEWLLGHQIEDVPREEMQRRFDAMFGQAE
jgi:uncharacterized glyoxalase superfamily protein PhnB